MFHTMLKIQVTKIRVPRNIRPYIVVWFLLVHHRARSEKKRTNEDGTHTIIGACERACREVGGVVAV